MIVNKVYVIYYKLLRSIIILLVLTALFINPTSKIKWL